MLLLILASYLHIILKKTNYPIINLYLIINIIIYYLPALIYLIFGLTHPSISYTNINIFDYKSLFFYGILLIFTFDLIVVFSYFFFNKELMLKFPYFKLIRNINFDNNFNYFFIIVFSSIVFFDFLNIVVTNSFMNADYMYCNPNLTWLVEIQKFINSFSLFNNIKQIISEFSNLKFYLLIITLYFYIFQQSKNSKNLLLFIIFYNFLIAIIIGSKFSLAIIFIIFFCVYFSSFLKLKNIFYTSILFFLSLFLFPLIGSIRSFFTIQFKAENCIVIKEKVRYILDGFNYNNINLTKDDGLINQFNNLSYLSEYFTEQSFLNKPFEILLSRLNYFDITLRVINLKLNSFIDNNFIFYFDNLYALIPRIFYPNKRIISNNSDHLSVDLGVMNEPINAVGLRPIAEGFYYIGYYYIIIAIFLGFLFYIFGKLFQSTNILVKSSSLYISILILKRDSFHALIPGLVHELIILIYLIIIVYFINCYKRRTLS